MMARNLLVLLSGAGLAQIITVAALPLLSRLYDPVSFGQLGAVMAVVSLATVVVHGRYHMAIPVSRDEDTARALLLASIFLSTVLSLPAVAVMLHLFGDLPEGMALWAFLLTAGALTLFSALVDILTYWRSHRGRFGASARNGAARAALTASAQVLLAKVTTMGMLIGTVIGTLMAVALALRDLLRRDESPLAPRPLNALLQVAREYRSYPLYGVPQGWLAAVSWNAMPLLLLRYGGTAVAGQYWVAYRVLIAPLSLFNGAYRQSTLPLLRNRPQDQARSLVARHTKFILLLAVIPLAALAALGEQLFSLAMGARWDEAGQIAGWMAAGILADLFKVPTVCLLQSQGRNRTILWWEAGILVARYASAVPFLVMNNTSLAIILFSCGGLLGWSLFTAIHLFPPKSSQN